MYSIQIKLSFKNPKNTKLGIYYITIDTTAAIGDNYCDIEEYTKNLLSLGAVKETDHGIIKKIKISELIKHEKWHKTLGHYSPFKYDVFEKFPGYTPISTKQICNGFSTITEEYSNTNEIDVSNWDIYHFSFYIEKQN